MVQLAVVYRTITCAVKKRSGGFACIVFEKVGEGRVRENEKKGGGGWGAKDCGEMWWLERLGRCVGGGWGEEEEEKELVWGVC